MFFWCFSNFFFCVFSFWCFSFWCFSFLREFFERVWKKKKTHQHVWENCPHSSSLFLLCALLCAALLLLSTERWTFVTMYLSATSLQVILLLLFVRIVSPMLFACQLDPDNFMTPCLTSLGKTFSIFEFIFEFISMLIFFEK